MKTVATLMIRCPRIKYVRQWHDAGLKYERFGEGRYRFQLAVNSVDHSGILALVKQGKILLEEQHEQIELTPQELNEHPFFELGDEHLPLFPEEYNSLLPGCPRCGFGKCFPDNLRLPIGKLKKNRLSFLGTAAAPEQLMLLPAVFQPLFVGCSGITFLPVEPVSQTRDGAVFVRIKITNVLPPMSGRTRFSPNGQAVCGKCHQPGWTLYEDIFYPDSARSKMADFNLTAEALGGMPFHWVIISQKVRRIILENKLLSPGCFSPIFFASRDTGTVNPVWQDTPVIEDRAAVPSRSLWRNFLDSAANLPAKIRMRCDPELLRLENAVIAGLKDESLHFADVVLLLGDDCRLKADADSRLQELLAVCHAGRYLPGPRLKTAILLAQKKNLAEIKKRAASLSDTDITIFDSDDWQRCSRGGRLLQFFATDDELQKWLLEALPDTCGPYTIVGADSVRNEQKRYSQRFFEFPIHKFKEAMYEKDSVRWEFWIRSKSITPVLNVSHCHDIKKQLSFSGLIRICHGSYSNRGFHDGWQESTIGIVTQIENANSGRQIINDEYLKIYKALEREIKKHLCYSSFCIFKDGSEVENTKFDLMTQGVVDQYNQGVPFVNRPGRRIKKTKE